MQIFVTLQKMLCICHSAVECSLLVREQGVEFLTPSHALYEAHLEGKERFTIKKYLLIIGKKKNMQVLSQTFIYFST